MNSVMCDFNHSSLSDVVHLILVILTDGSDGPIFGGYSFSTEVKRINLNATWQWPVQVEVVYVTRQINKH